MWKRLTSFGPTPRHDTAIVIRDQITLYLNLCNPRILQIVQLGESNNTGQRQPYSQHHCIETRGNLLLSNLIVSSKIDRVLKPLGKHDLQAIFAVDILARKKIHHLGSVVQA